MPSERITEELTLSEMGLKLGKNDSCHVFVQGDCEGAAKIEACLKKAGGKPAACSLDDFTKGGVGKGKPEYIITFDKKRDTIIVVECKKSPTKHESPKRDQPRDYAVDGALYYAKFLKSEYNVIVIAVSGTKRDKWKVSAFDWRKGQETPQELSKGKDVLYAPDNYLLLIDGESVRKALSLEDIQKMALEMHEALRKLAVPVKDKPVFIAGILIALKDSDFMREYPAATSFQSLLGRLQTAIGNVLKGSDIRPEKIEDMHSRFKIIGGNVELKDIPLGHYNSLSWYIEELDNKIKPMMDYADSTIDALGIFYHEFVKYGGSDGGELGIVLTPQHLTEFMCDLAEVNKNSKVVDICCGSGAFLVSAMAKMFKDANTEEICNIRKNALYGVEKDSDIYTLAIANMIVRGDGKSNILNDNCFKPEVIKWLKDKRVNVGIINPPYAQKDHSELKFVENMLDLIIAGGAGVAVVPMSCAIGTKFKEERERLFKKHALKAVFSMPDDIFYTNNACANVCVMVWEAHKPHDSNRQTFFGYYKEDGFVKAKKLGRIDKFNRWEKIKKEWLNLYHNLDVKEGLTAKKAVRWDDEWLCEAYMETDYSKLTQNDFENSVNNYLAYLVKSRGLDENK